MDTLHRVAVGALLLIAGIATTSRAAAQDAHEHRHDDDDHHGLHFAHPLFTESVSPDTKLRLDFVRSWEADVTESEIELEAEYAFHRSASLEITAPYGVLDRETGGTVGNLGNLEVALKFANFAFEEQGVLLGYGLEVGIPTGSDTEGIGSSHLWDLEPFLNVGLKRERFEAVAWTRFGIPVNQRNGEEIETELHYDLSVLYHIAPRLQGLLELNGQLGLSGEEAGAGFVSLSPGVKVAPFPIHSLFLGLGGNFPLSDEELDARVRFSVFYHF